MPLAPKKHAEILTNIYKVTLRKLKDPGQAYHATIKGTRADEKTPPFFC